MGLEKLIRNPENCDVKISKKEQNFRKTFPSFEETKDKCPLKCTACSLNLTPFIASGNSCHLHTFLKVLVCKKCKTFYGDGDFSTDEDGDEKYCRWCGEGGKLIFCDKCNCGFCKGCIKRNFSRDFYNELRSSESWDCFLCKPEPLFELRAKACAAEKYFISHSKKEHHKNKNERQPETSKDTKNAKISSVSTKPATNGDKKETLVVARKWLGEAMDNALDLAEQIQIKSKKIKEKKITDASIQSCDDVVTLEVNIQKFYDSLIGNIKEMKVALADDIKLWKSSYTRDLGSGTSSNASGGENGGALQNGDQGGSGDDDDDDTGKKLDGKCDSSKQRGRKSVDSCGGEGSDKESSGRRKSRTTSSSEEEEEVGEKTAQKLTENGASDDDDKSTDNSDRDVDDRSDGGLDLQMECVDKDDGDDDDDDSKSRVKIANSLDEQKKIGKTNEKSRKEVKDSNVDVDGNDSETDGKSENRGKLKNRRRLKNEKGVSDVESIVSNSSVGGNQTADEKSVKSRRSRSSKAESEIDKVGSDASDSEVEAGIKVELQQSAERLLEASSSDDDLLDLDSVAEKQTDQKTKRLSKRSVSHKMDDEEKKSKDTKVESSKSEKEKEEDKESKEIARLANLDSLERSARTVIDSDEENSSEDVKPKLKKPKSPVKKEKASASVSEASGDNSSDSSDDVESDDDEYDDLIDYKLPSFKKNEDCQQKVLQYIFESSLSECSENDTEKEQGKNKKKKTMKKNRISDEDSDDDHKKDDGSDVSVSAANIFQIKQRSWRRDKLLTEKLTDTDTSEDEKRKSKWKRKKQQKESSDSASSDSEDQKLSKKTKEKANIVLSDSDIMEVESESNDSSSSSVLIISKSKKRKRSSSSDGNSSDDFKKKTKKKRKRIINNSSSETEGEGGNEDELNESNASQGKGGRRNIKKIMKDRDVADATRSAAKEEEERRQRILERQKLYNSIYEAVEEKATKTVDKLVLDFDLKTKEPIISVDKGLVAKMKPHQAKGVKFMWDACFESVEQIKTSKGGGCILAHCMGLGKTFQVVSLVHTVLTYKKLTKVKRVLIVCPFSTVLNWNAEFDKWLKEVDKNDDLNVNHLINEKQNYQRSYRLKDWHEEGGVMIMGYDMFRNLTNANSKMFKGKIKKTFQNTLVDPGADLVVCDEGHLLKNEATALSKAMTRIKTLRRIVLTGTPLQNNLVEYHCMVSFIKPNLLGSKKEFQNRFVNPITNGQFVDSTERDFRIMKRRAHVLHKMLDGLVQRRDYNVLTPYLPPKQEYVLSVRLTDLQVQLYQKFLENRGTITKGMKVLLLADFQQLSRVWTHPLALKYTFEKQLKKAEAENNSDSAGSLKDFVVDGSSDDETSSQSSSDNESSNKKGAAKRLTRANKTDDNDLNKMTDDPETLTVADKLAWWSGIVKQEHFDDITVSSKLILLFDFLKECHEIGDKVLVFSQSLYSLDLIEYFLEKIDDATQAGSTDENPQLLGHSGSWSKGLDYFRLDGSSKGEDRSYCIKSFNRESNTRARLFLISTKAGGLGINLTAANRVVIFDASWNPSHDIQSIFRIYRFGQRKPCYIYRFIAQGTMEQKVYERQISKLSLSQRVVDEQQVNRYFTHSDLQELYNFQPAREEDAPTPIVPKDRLMADMLQKHKKWIFKIIEHDSLLDHVEEEELDEAERKAAWEEYENDKKRALTPPSLPQIQIPASAFDFNNVKSCLPPDSYERLVKAFKEKYPHKSEQEIRTIAVQTMTQTYINQENERLARQLLQARQAQSHQQFVQALSVAQNGGQATTYHHQPMVGAINRNMVPYSSARPPPAHSSSYSSTSSYRTASPLINSTTSSSSANLGKR